MSALYTNIETLSAGRTPGPGSTVVDLNSLLTGGAARFLTFVCSGIFVGNVSVEGSMDSSSWGVLATFSMSPDGNSGVGRLLEPKTVEAIVRYLRLSTQGDLKTSVTVSVGAIGTAASVNLQDPVSLINAVNFPFGGQLVASAEIALLAQDVFNNPTGGGTTPNVRLWTVTPVNGGTGALDNGQLSLNTNGAANGSIVVSSIIPARNVAGNVNGFISQVQLDTPVANNLRRWGNYDDSNGYFYEMSGTGLYVVSRKLGVDTRVAQADFNGGVPFTWNPYFGLWEIFFSGVFVWFALNRQVLHTLFIAEAPRVAIETLGLRFENTNSAGLASSIELNVDNVAAVRFGVADPVPEVVHLNSNATTVIKNTSGNLHRITINTNGSGANTISVYDNISAVAADLLAVINGTAQGTFEYGFELHKGLTIVCAGGSAPDFTVIYD